MFLGHPTLPYSLYSRSPLPHLTCFPLAQCFFPLRTSLQSPAYLWSRVIHLPWRWRRYVPPKRQFKPGPHVATSQKTIFFNFKIFLHKMLGALMGWYFHNKNSVNHSDKCCLGLNDTSVDSTDMHLYFSTHEEWSWEQQNGVKEQAVKTAASEIISCIRLWYNMCIHVCSKSTCATRIADTRGNAHSLTLLASVKNDWAKFSHKRKIS
jgi:hypothetical protein